MSAPQPIIRGPIRPPLRPRGATDTAHPLAGCSPAPELAVPAPVELTRAQTLIDTLIDTLESQFSRYLVLDSGLALVLALWSLSTHLYESFDAFPYLAITGPTKRCGKTRAAEVLELVCARPLRTVAMTPAVLFRSIQLDKPTLIIDEAEVLRGRDERASELRAILNAGHRRGQFVRRCEPKSHQIQSFETYGPKVLVLIGTLPDTLADRSIPIRMRRKTGSEKVDRLNLRHANSDSQMLQTLCSEWARAHREQVSTDYSTGDLLFLEDREAELWLPLFVVCRIAAPHRVADLEMVARRLAGAKATDEPGDIGIRLLTDVRGILSKVQDEDRIQTSVLLGDLDAVEDAPWPTYCRGKAIDARALANLLRPFGISSQNLRYGLMVTKGYMLASFRDAFERYLPPESATPPQSRETQG